jgi:hypothetical protein
MQGEETVEIDEALGNGRSGIQIDAGTCYRALPTIAVRLSAVRTAPAVLAAARIQNYGLLFTAPFTATATFAATALRSRLALCLHLFAAGWGTHGRTGRHRINTARDGRQPVIGFQALYAAVFRNEG